ncbi:MAG TPA: universal stress protein [Terriglobales bacterium]|nr:universal stress protein [Terriglobales bacterium]
MLPFKKILCPTDFSQPSYEALKEANELAEHFSAELLLVHVLAPIPVITAATTPMSAGAPAINFDVVLYEKELKAWAEKKLGEIIDQKLSKELKIQMFLAYGKAADEIVKIAEKEKADLIVISTHGETGFRHLIFGSVAEKVVRHAHCPVLTVRASHA